MAKALARGIRVCQKGGDSFLHVVRDDFFFGVVLLFGEDDSEENDGDEQYPGHLGDRVV